MHWFKKFVLLLKFVSKPIRGSTHAERLESFYSYQAEQYDAFRKPFLRGRDELASRLPFGPGIRWCDLGCGTGYLLQAVGPASKSCSEIMLVDLCPSLLAEAAKKIESGGWRNAVTITADTTLFLPVGELDIVTFSYSLSMTPNWFAAIDQAYRMLKPGGVIGVVDFYVARKHPIGADHQRHRWWTHHFWPAWFDIDNVRPCADHIPYLYSKFEVSWFVESRTRVPGMPWLWPPYYALIGRKP